jgi:cyclopropane-fatty-acyl-phospholipid synthase
LIDFPSFSPCTHQIVDLGCGWGSVTLFLAHKYPNSKITSTSNSNSQREFIMQQARERGFNNVRVITGDIAVYDLPEEDIGRFDRIISIEMFEHMKNYGLLLKKLATWLVPGGKLFGTFRLSKSCIVGRGS